MPEDKRMPGVADETSENLQEKLQKSREQQVADARISYQIEIPMEVLRYFGIYKQEDINPNEKSKLQYIVRIMKENGLNDLGILLNIRNLEQQTGKAAPVGLSRIMSLYNEFRIKSLF